MGAKTAVVNLKAAEIVASDPSNVTLMRPYWRPRNDASQAPTSSASDRFLLRVPTYAVHDKRGMDMKS